MSMEGWSLNPFAYSPPASPTLSNYPKTDHLYAAADALQIELHEMPDGKIRGCAPCRWTVGSFWHFTSDMVVCSDVVTSISSAYFVRFAGDLWGYMMSAPSGIWLLFFDGGRAKVKAHDVSQAATGNVQQTLVRLKDCLLDGYYYDDLHSTVAKWTPIDVVDLVSKLGAGHAPAPPTAPPGKAV